MFLNIFLNEIKYWFNRPAFYVYTIVFFMLGMLISAASAGIFDVQFSVILKTLAFSAMKVKNVALKKNLLQQNYQKNRSIGGKNACCNHFQKNFPS